jgi:hypothetical protein
VSPRSLPFAHRRAAPCAHALAAALLAVAFPEAARPEPATTPGQPPEERRVSYFVDGYEQTVRPLTRGLDPSVLYRRLSGSHREAANVGEDDQVRLPSTWWQPRLGFRPVSIGQMLAGPGPATGPAAGKWRVVKAKSLGVSEGFQIKDATGTRFAIKFDPIAYPELTTSADVIGSHIYWAAGYNVPDNVIVHFRREDLEIAPDANVDDPLKGRIPMTGAFIDTLLSRVHRAADGGYRAVASRFIAGKPLGEFKYSGRRKDDPEDLIPHELRRELRGLWTINSWVHHDDCASRNTLDLWVTDGGRSFVRHHLIDFNGILGAASIDKHSYRSGFEYLLDYGVAFKNTVTAGLLPGRWESSVDPEMPSVGFYDAKTFDPAGWRPFLPNPAFDERTLRDIRWGAKIVAGFSDELIRAAVEQGELSDRRAEDYLVRTMIERRDIIVRRWLGASYVASAR